MSPDEIKSDENAAKEPAMLNFSNLENSTLDYLSRVKARADEITSAALNEIESLKNKVEIQLQTRSDELDQRDTSLREKEEELVNRIENFNREKEDFIRKTVEEGRLEGYTRGFDQGHEQGYISGQEKAASEEKANIEKRVQELLNEHTNGLVPTLDKLVREMQGNRQALLKRWEEDMLQIAATLAYQSMERELSHLPEVPLGLLREALELAVSSTSMKIRMNPSDVERLRDQLTTILQETGTVAKSELVTDPRITPGGCIIETQSGTIDQRLESRMKRIISELS